MKIKVDSRCEDEVNEYIKLCFEVDEYMTPMDTPMKVKDKVSSFLCLHNDKTKNLLLPNIGIPNVFRDNGDDDREWICHEQDRSPHHHLPSKNNSLTLKC